MGTIKTNQQKKCTHCGRYFKPDKRAWKRQQTCQDKVCRAKQKKQSQKKWIDANPDYFKCRYENTRQWRSEHPDYQREWRAKRREIQDEMPPAKPIKIIRLAIPEKLLKDEIQDEIRLVKQCGCGFFVAGRGMQDTRRDGIPNAFQISSSHEMG